MSCTQAGTIVLVGPPLLCPQRPAECLPFSQCPLGICGAGTVMVKAGQQIHEGGCLFFF